jgi:hypothetical protein
VEEFATVDEQERNKQLVELSKQKAQELEHLQHSQVQTKQVQHDSWFISNAES